MSLKTFTEEEWVAEVTRRFGTNVLDWKFVCPSCRRVTSVREWKDAGASEGEIAFSCVGRSNGGRAGCNYAGGGLFRMNPVRVKTIKGATIYLFDFAEAEEGEGEYNLHLFTR